MHKQVIFLRLKCGIRNGAVEMRTSGGGCGVGVRSSERKRSKEAAGVR